MDAIKNRLVTWMITTMIARLSPEMIKKWIDHGLDLLEEHIANTPTTTDDELIMPIIKVLRGALNVPEDAQ